MMVESCMLFVDFIFFPCDDYVQVLLVSCVKRSFILLLCPFETVCGGSLKPDS